MRFISASIKIKIFIILRITYNSSVIEATSTSIRNVFILFFIVFSKCWYSVPVTSDVERNDGTIHAVTNIVCKL